jgi:hypothetical protein
VPHHQDARAGSDPHVVADAHELVRGALQAQREIAALVTPGPPLDERVVPDDHVGAEPDAADAHKVRQNAVIADARPRVPDDTAVPDPESATACGERPVAAPIRSRA